MGNIITYYIASDYQGKLKQSAKLACNLWNQHIQPKLDIVIRLEVFNKPLSSTTGIAYKPYEHNNTRYCTVALNRRFLKKWDINKIAGTIAHEIGHALGFGWDKWMDLVTTKDGTFRNSAIQSVPELSQMRIHLGGNIGTKWSHWDEQLFDKELMTPFKDNAEDVLPISIDVLVLLGHSVTNRLLVKTSVNKLLNNSSQKSFDIRGELPTSVLEYFEETEIFETLPHET